MIFDPDLYYEEFLRYHELAKVQQKECNLGTTPHMEGTVTDPLMRNIELYDVVERKYAGFTQILLDMWYGDTPDHPYYGQFHRVRAPIARAYTGVNSYWGLREWLYIFILHRVTGSAINYARKPSGYSNTILPQFSKCHTMEEIVARTEKLLQDPMTKAYTSVGYQFPAFPKRTPEYRRGGDKFLIEHAPMLAMDLAGWLEVMGPSDLREVGEFMFKWNTDRGMRRFIFQYSAVIADIADFFPHLVNRGSPFYYGSNAVECIAYMTNGKRSEKALDEVMLRAMEATGNVPYNLEDVACDFIRYIENYIKPGNDYDHVDRDTVFNTSGITDHPFGRQKAMLELGYVNSFNILNVHPADDYIIRQAGRTVEDYWADLVML